MAIRDRTHADIEKQMVLRQTDMALSGSENAHTPIGGQTIFFTLIYNGADAAGKRSVKKRYMGNGRHDGTGLGKRIALEPLVGTGERYAAVFFYIANAAVKAVIYAVYGQSALQSMGHADNAMAALHGKEAKRSHDI